MNRLAVTLVVLISTAVAGGLVLPDVDTWVRIPAVLAFALIVPGLGWAARMRLEDVGDTLLAAVTISVSLLVVVGEGMALAHRWSITDGFLVLAAAALLGIALPHGAGRHVTSTGPADGQQRQPAGGQPRARSADEQWIS